MRTDTVEFDRVDYEVPPVRSKVSGHVLFGPAKLILLGVLSSIHELAHTA